MASSLYRLLSAGRGSLDVPKDAQPTTPRFSSSLPASPSLNDFSMGAAAEFEESCVPSPASALSPRASLDSQPGRFSFDARTGAADAPARSADVRSLLWRNSMSGSIPAYGPARTPAMPIPIPGSTSTPPSLPPLSPRASAPEPALTPPTPPPAAAADAAAAKLGARARGRRGAGGGKIDGLDYYEYVELIRASSL